MSKQSKSKRAPAPAVAATQAQQVAPVDTLDMLKTAIVQALSLDGIRKGAKEAGQGIAGVILKVAQAHPSLEGFNAEIGRCAAWLISQPGIDWQKAEGLKLGISKDGKSAVLPRSFIQPVSRIRTYLTAQDQGVKLPALSEVKSESALRKQLTNKEVTKATTAHRIAGLKLTDAQRQARMAEADERTTIRDTMSLMAQRIASLKGDSVSEARKAVNVAADVVFALFTAQVDAENAAKAETTRKRAMSQELPEAASEPATQAA